MTGRAAWLRDRRSSLGGSDAPAILGLGYKNFGPQEVYESKTEDVPDREPSLLMLMGNWLEPHILDLYEKKTGLKVTRPVAGTIIRDESIPWRHFTPDGVIQLPNDDLRLAQVKYLQFPGDEWGEEYTDQVPDMVTIQVQHELSVGLASGYIDDTVAAVVAMSPSWGEVREYRIDYAPQLADMIQRVECEFWQRVEFRSGVADWNPPLGLQIVETLRAIRAAEEIELGEEAVSLAAGYEMVSAEIAHMEKQKKDLRLQLIEALRGAGRGRLPDGRVVRQKVVTVAPDPHPKPKAGYSYVDLRVIKAPKQKGTDLNGNA